MSRRNTSGDEVLLKKVTEKQISEWLHQAREQYPRISILKKKIDAIKLTLPKSPTEITSYETFLILSYQKILIEEENAKNSLQSSETEKKQSKQTSNANVNYIGRQGLRVVQDKAKNCPSLSSSRDDAGAATNVHFFFGVGSITILIFNHGQRIGENVAPHKTRQISRSTPKKVKFFLSLFK